MVSLEIERCAEGILSCLHNWVNVKPHALEYDGKVPFHGDHRRWFPDYAKPGEFASFSHDVKAVRWHRELQWSDVMQDGRDDYFFGRESYNCICAQGDQSKYLITSMNEGLMVEWRLPTEVVDRLEMIERCRKRDYRNSQRENCDE